MTDRLCEIEPQIVNAVRTDSWDDAMRSHLNVCETCREAVGVVRALNLFASQDIAIVPLAPDPQIVYMKASFAERQSRQIRVSRITTAASSFALLAGVAAIYKLVTHGGPSVFSGAVGKFPELPVGFTGSPPVLVMILAALLVLLISSPMRGRS